MEDLFGNKEKTLEQKVEQPKDKGLLLQDILEPNVPERYYLSEKTVANMLKHKERQQEAGNGFGIDIRQPKDKGCALTVGGKMTRDLIEQPTKSEERLYKNLKDCNDKGACLLATSYKGAWANGMTLISQPTCIAMRGREACLSPKRTEYGKAIRKDYEAGKVEEQRKNIQQLEPRNDGKTNTLTTVQKDNLIFEPKILQRPRGFNKGGSFSDKTPTLSSHSWEQNNVLLNNTRIRRLTPTECSRLQTIPKWYRWECSDTQQYKMLGNGWTVDVIKHLFSFLKR